MAYLSMISWGLVVGLLCLDTTDGLDAQYI